MKKDQHNGYTPDQLTPLPVDKEAEGNVGDGGDMMVKPHVENLDVWDLQKILGHNPVKTWQWLHTLYHNYIAHKMA